MDLRLHRSLYPEAAVRAAAAAWAEVLTVRIETADADLAVHVEAIDPDYEGQRAELLDAFANHALWEAISLHRGASA